MSSGWRPRPRRPRRGGFRPAEAGPGRGRARDGPVLAALDLGTNNCRLLIARPHGDGFRVIDAFSRIVRLGQGVAGAGALSSEAMDRTVEALRICAGKMRRREVTLARTVATEACRRARNGAEFVARVKRETGLDLEVIGNEEEAELALAGCRPLFDPAIPDAIVFDIGGGSTELAWLRRDAEGRRLSLDVMSMPIGVVTLRERYGGDRFDEDAYRAMVAECAARLAPFDARHAIAARARAGKAQMLGTSGTVTTLSGLRLGLRRYARDRVDGTFLDAGEARRLARGLAADDFAARAAQPCIGRERADLIVAGCAILEAIWETWPTSRLRVADRGLREGILLGLLERAR